MRLHPSSWTAMVSAAVGWLSACHQPCELDTVPQNSTFRATVVASSAECPEVVPLRAGDVLTVRAGRIADDGECEGNVSLGLPPEFPSYPGAPYRIDDCVSDLIGVSRFECSVVAPDCVTGDIQGPGDLDGALQLDRYPNRGEVRTGELVVTVAVGADPSCRRSCFTKIPVTVERL